MMHLMVVFALFGAATSASRGMVTGGKQDQGPSNPKFMDIAWKAVKTLNEDSAAYFGPYAMIPIKVLKVQSQVVAGVIYDLEVLYGESGCKKKKVDLTRLQMADCRVMNTGTKAVYKIYYYANPGQNYEQIGVSGVKVLSRVKESDPPPVAPAYEDPSKPEYMNIAWKAAKPLNEDSIANPGPYAMVPIKVLKVESQLVSGTIDHLDVLYGESSCKKQEVDLGKLNMANCRVMNEGKKAIYYIYHYVIPWQNYEQINVEKKQN